MTSGRKTDINKWLLILVIILSLIVLLLTGFIIMTLLVKSPNKPLPINQEITQKTIKDIDTLTELSTKIDALLSKPNEQYQVSTSTYGYAYRYGLLKNTLTEEDKQWIVLDTINTWENITGDDWKNSHVKDYIENSLIDDAAINVFKNNKQLSGDIVNVYSKKLFGKAITNPKESIGVCPIYLYEPTQNMYYYPEPRCGGTTTEMVKTYKSKFEEIGKEAHVYVSFAFLTTPGTNSAIETYTIYKDFDYSEELYFGKISYKDIYQTAYSFDSAKDFMIDATNYLDFSEYKFTFKQDENNNYYFVKVEQIK